MGRDEFAIGLGTGTALDTLNDNITGFTGFNRVR
jgi:hypothetical protein